MHHVATCASVFIAAKHTPQWSLPMPQCLVTFRTPAAAIQVDGDALPRLAGSPIERALSRILRPTLSAVAQTVDSKFDPDRLDLGHGFHQDQLQFVAVLSQARQSEILDACDQNTTFSSKYVETLISLATCVAEVFRLRADGNAVQIVYERSGNVSWSISSECSVNVSGPSPVQQCVRGLMALVKRLAANRDADVDITIDRRPLRFRHVRSLPDIATTATEQVDGVIVGVDDLSATTAVRNQHRLPNKVFHLSLPNELREAALRFQLDRSLVRVVAEVARRGKKAISGRVLVLEEIGGIDELAAAAVGRASQSPANADKVRKVRRKR